MGRRSRRENDLSARVPRRIAESHRIQFRSKASALVGRCEVRTSEEGYFMRIGLFICLLALIAGCSESDPSVLTDSRARELIEEHFSDWHKEVAIQEFKFSGVMTGPGLMNKLIAELDPFKKVGLIDYKVAKNLDGGWLETVTSSLTEKGKATPHIARPENPNIVAFVAGHREIMEVINVDPTAGVVLFSYQFEPNDLGRAAGQAANKFRGKATFEYDAFQKRHIFRRAEVSGWDDERWKDTTWVDEKDGTKIIVLGSSKK